MYDENVQMLAPGDSPHASSPLPQSCNRICMVQGIHQLSSEMFASDVLQEIAKRLRCDTIPSMHQHEAKELTAEIHLDDIHMCGREKESTEGCDNNFSEKVAMRWSKRCGPGDTHEFLKNRRLVKVEGALIAPNKIWCGSWSAWRIEKQLTRCRRACCQGGLRRQLSSARLVECCGVPRLCIRIG